jgi:hypothetical protein
VLEVTSDPFKDTSPIWVDEVFPARVQVKEVINLTPETAVPILHLKDRLSIFQNQSSLNAWTGHVRGSPAKRKVSDGEAIVKAVMEAKRRALCDQTGCTATGLVQVGTQRTNAFLKIAENCINKPDYRTHQDGL